MAQDTEDRPRGFLTEADREFLTTPEEELDVQEQTKRKRRNRIRERTYNAILDFQLLEEMDQDNHEVLFEDIQKNWMDDAYAVRAMFEFVCLGLLETELAEAVPSLIEESLERSTADYNDTHGEYLRMSSDVEISVEYEFDSVEDPEPNA